MKSKFLQMINLIKEKTYFLPLFMLILGGIGFLLKYLFNVFAARYLPTSVYGDLFLAIKILNIIGPILLLGSNASAKKFLSVYIAEKDFASAANYIGWNFRLLGFSSLIFFMLLLFFYFTIITLDHYHIKLLNTYHLVIYMLWVSPLFSTSSMFVSLLFSNKNYYTGAVFNSLIRYILMIGSFLICVNLISKTVNNFELVSIIFSAFFLLTILEGVATFIYMPSLLKAGIKKIFSITKEADAWKKTASYVLSNSIVFMFLGVTDLLIVAIFAKDKDQIGYYSTCLMISGVIWFVSESIQQFLKPQVGFYFKNLNLLGVQKILNITALLQVLTCGAFFILITVFSKIFLGHFGPQYLQASGTLFILAAASFIVSISRIGITLLVYCDKENILLIANVVTLITVIVLGGFLTHLYGMNGAALAYFIAISCKSIFVVIMVRRYYPSIKSCIIF